MSAKGGKEVTLALNMGVVRATPELGAGGVGSGTTGDLDVGQYWMTIR
jgi:hypothetical protein